MMKKRKLGIALLLMLAVVVTTGTFAYWASSIAGDTAVNGNVTVSIGEGAAQASTLTLTAYTANTGSALVPTGNGGGDTATWTIPMDWDQDSGTEYSGATGDLTITNVTYVMSGFTSAELEVLFTASIPVTELTEGATSQDVILSVVFDHEPADKAEYDLIVNGTLTITVTFGVNPN